MNTEFSAVFRGFLNKITDTKTWANLTNYQVEDDLTDILNSAIAEFSSCQANLELIDYTNKNLGSQLSNMENNILQHYMVKSWWERQLNDSDIADLKFDEYRGMTVPSQANHINVLDKRIARKEKEIEKLVWKYSKKTSGLSGMAGDPDEIE